MTKSILIANIDDGGMCTNIAVFHIAICEWARQKGGQTGIAGTKMGKKSGMTGGVRDGRYRGMKTGEVSRVATWRFVDMESGQTGEQCQMCRPDVSQTGKVGEWFVGQLCSVIGRLAGGGAGVFNSGNWECACRSELAPRQHHYKAAPSLSLRNFPSSGQCAHQGGDRILALDRKRLATLDVLKIEFLNAGRPLEKRTAVCVHSCLASSITRPLLNSKHFYARFQM